MPATTLAAGGYARLAAFEVRTLQAPALTKRRRALKIAVMSGPLDTGAAKRTSLDERLSKVEHDLMQTARRLYALEAFVEELDRVTGRKPFRIWNDIVWMMLLDSRDMLVIYLASWTKHLVEAGGLFAELKANHLPDLPAKRRPTNRTDNDAHLRSLLDGYHQAAVSRLFPELAAETATPAALDDLVRRVRQSSDGLRNDRNQNRAHAFERGKPATAKMLDFMELRQHVHAPTGPEQAPANRARAAGLLLAPRPPYDRHPAQRCNAGLAHGREQIRHLQHPQISSSWLLGHRTRKLRRLAMPQRSPAT